MIVWYIAGYALGGTIGWLASLVHATGHAPLGLTSLIIGALLGASMSGIAASLGIQRRHLIVGIILFAIITVLTQHAWLYLEFLQQWQQAIAAKPEAALFRPTPPSALEYFSNELTLKSAALWSLDACLIIANATAVVVVLQRKWLNFTANPQSEIRNPKSPDT